MKHLLPIGNRRDDPPDKSWQWRLGLAINKFPIQAAIFLAVCLLAIPVWIIIEQQVHLRSDAKDQRANSAAIGKLAITATRLTIDNRRLLSQIQGQRRDSIGVLCADNTAIVSVLAEIPPSKRTEAQEKALKTARGVDCSRLVTQIEATRPKPPAPPKRKR